jgi:hypothetical protein
MIMRDRARVTLCLGVISAAVVAAVTGTGRQAQADDPNSAPNPYHAVDHWAKH